VLALLLLAGCATLSPGVRGVYLAHEPEPQSDRTRLGTPLVALVGDIGAPRSETPELVARLSRRLAAAPRAPVVVLGDVFYSVGLLGSCPSGAGPWGEDGGTSRAGDRGTSRAGDRGTSRAGCRDPGPPERQLESVLGPYRDALGDRPLIAIAGNHDHLGGDAATRNACTLVPRAHPSWRYLSRGCGLDPPAAVAALDLGGLVLFALDSEPMLRDPEYRRAALEALGTEVARYRDRRPEAWRVVATHHPLESYGQHNGASLGSALIKDLYSIRLTLLLPITWAIERRFGPQEIYALGYRSYRRELYAALARHPVDLIASGHDHSLQHVAIDRPGARHQVVSGAGVQRTPVKRYGLDLLWSNRLARALGLGQALPAPEHELRFALSGGRDPAERSGYGFAVLAHAGDALALEFWDARSDAPLYVARIARPAEGGAGP
jgi:hypothetical protein